MLLACGSKIRVTAITKPGIEVNWENEGRGEAAREKNPSSPPLSSSGLTLAKLSRGRIFHRTNHKSSAPVAKNKTSSKLKPTRGQHENSLWLSLFLIFDHNQYLQWLELYSFYDGMLTLSLIKLLQIKMQCWKINGGKKSMRAHCKTGHKIIWNVNRSKSWCNFRKTGSWDCPLFIGACRYTSRCRSRYAYRCI